jgi:hypothetical protein
LNAANQKEEERFMSEKTKPEVKPEELTKEQLERVSGGYGPIDGVVTPKPLNPVDGFVPVDGYTPIDG